MKKSLGLLAFFLLFCCSLMAQTKDLIALDLAWERALLTSDVTFLDKVLADDFVWVHNHASLIDGKKEAVARAKRIQAGESDNTKNAPLAIKRWSRSVRQPSSAAIQSWIGGRVP